MRLSLFWIFMYSVLNSEHVKSDSLQAVDEEEVTNLLKEEKYVVLLLSDNADCVGLCRVLETTLAAVREDLVEGASAWVVRTYNPSLSRAYGIEGKPAVVFVRQGLPLLYTGPPDDDEILLETLLTNRESTVRTLIDDTFEHETQASTGATTGDWLVMFVKKDCDECASLRSTVEAVAAQLHGKKNLAIINRDEDGGQTTRRFGVKDFPSFILFRLGRLYRYNLPQLDAPTLVAFATDGFHNARTEEIPTPKTPFDDLTEQIADWLRENPFYVNSIVITLCVIVVLLIAMIFLSSRSSNKENKSKRDKDKTDKKKKKV